MRVEETMIDGSSEPIPAAQIARQQQAEKQFIRSGEKLRRVLDEKQSAKSQYLNQVCRDTIVDLNIDFSSPRTFRKIERDARIAVNESRQQKEEIQRELHLLRTEEEKLRVKLDRVKQLRENLENCMQRSDDIVKTEEKRLEMIITAKQSKDGHTLQKNLLQEFSNERLTSNNTSAKEYRAKFKRATSIVRAVEEENKRDELGVLIEKAASEAFAVASSQREGRAMARTIRKNEAVTKSLGSKFKSDQKMNNVAEINVSSSSTVKGAGRISDNIKSLSVNANKKVKRNKVSFADDNWKNPLTRLDIFMISLIVIVAISLYYIDEDSVNYSFDCIVKTASTISDLLSFNHRNDGNGLYMLRTSLQILNEKVENAFSCAVNAVGKASDIYLSSGVNCTIQL